MTANNVTTLQPPAASCVEDSVVMPLIHARATLDLIHKMASEGREDRLLDCLRHDTLADAVHSAMVRISEAIDGVERLQAARTPAEIGRAHV